MVKGEEQLMKADIKRELLDSFAFPELDILFSQFYAEQSDLNQEKNYLGKTLESVGFKYRLLLLLKDKFEDSKDLSSLSIIDEKLAALESFMNQSESESLPLSSESSACLPPRRPWRGANLGGG